MSLPQSSIFDPYSLAKLIEAGSPVLMPTDTLPALAVRPSFAEKVWRIKQRPKEKPLILMGASPEDLFEVVSQVAIADAWAMANSYWPGALTLVLPASGAVVDALNPGRSSIGMRIPDSLIAKEFLKISGPLATTSANLAGERPSFTANDAAACFPDLPLLGPIPWPKSSCQASTLISWQEEGCWQLLRKGAVMPSKL